MKIQYIVSRQVLTEMPAGDRYETKTEVFERADLAKAIQRYNDLAPDYAVTLTMQIMHEYDEVTMLESDKSKLPF